jgi:gamma-glutamylcysteine synthetase
VCGLLKWRGLKNVAGEHAVVGASMARDVDERLGKRRGLTGGGRGTERESGRVGKGMALTGRPHRAARGRESKSARVGTDRRSPPIKLRGPARGGLGLMGRLG